MLTNQVFLERKLSNKNEISINNRGWIVILYKKRSKDSSYKTLLTLNPILIWEIRNLQYEIIILYVYQYFYTSI